MKRLQIKENYIKDFERKLTSRDFYNDGMINDKRWMSPEFKEKYFIEHWILG